MTNTRRQLLAGFGAALLASADVRAQSGKRDSVRTIGYLVEPPRIPPHDLLLARLRELGYVEGRNLRFEIRRIAAGASSAERDRTAQELVRLNPDLLLASGALLVTALHRATSKIPIVSGGVPNPVRLGFAKTLRRPGANVTGLSYGLPEVAALQIGAMRAVLPRLKSTAHLGAHTSSAAEAVIAEYEAATKAAGLAMQRVTVETLDDVDRALRAIRDPSAEAAFFGPLPDNVRAEQVAAIAIRFRTATHALAPQLVGKGLLMSYWLRHSDWIGRVASLIDKVLRGGNPAEIPFEGPEMTELAFNRATAAAIGVRLPEDLLLRATEVVG
jgi:putative tryptophan/tyrosine transport system substrate-binding protein